MPTSLTFVQASGFWLGRPIGGLEQLTPGLVDRLMEAPRKTLLRLAEVAAAESADLVLLAGDVLSAGECSARDVFALLELAETLEASRIPAVWLAHPAERESLFGFTFPDAFHILPCDEGGELLIATRAGSVRVVAPAGESAGSAAAGQLEDTKAAIFSLGMTYGPSSLEDLASRQVDYIAVAGGAQRWEGTVGEVRAHDAGPALVPAPDGAIVPTISVVTLDRSGRVFLRAVSVAAVRWRTVSLFIGAESQETSLAAQVIQEAEACRAGGDTDWLFRLRLVGSLDLLLPLKQQRLDQHLRDLLQARYGQQPPFVWPAEIIWEPTEPWPEAWLNQDSFPGELLREGLRLSEAPQELVASLPGVTPTEETSEDWGLLVKQALLVGLEALADQEGSGQGEGRN